MSGGADELKRSCSERFCTLHVDVTQDDSVQKAKEFVEKNLGKCELWAIVNNAGIYKGMIAEFTKISDYQDVLDVNTLGQVRVTKAFLPLLRKSTGRVVNVNSITGRISLAHITPYTMSKCAAVGFTECLRRELDAWRIKVISIEPEFFK
ncbi:estradiol 17-beta-dehydrogenase 2 [Caerostris extrusa]|uniref:Estradiol 17-beta-dehydrogenase 2 n=1 Tax=Caerostris extrusa TaxID=172846 RepID=A0AAV4UCZ6_CAEEX|nr:estradiol 17-beta-dehydrogenase 2 [Caerostris extrusa]